MSSHVLANSCVYLMRQLSTPTARSDQSDTMTTAWSTQTWGASGILMQLMAAVKKRPEPERAQLWPQHSLQHWPWLPELVAEAQHTITNHKSHLGSSAAALPLWDTSGCCALHRKVGGNCCGCGGNPCVFEPISITLIGLAKTDTASSGDCVRVCK